VLLCSAVVCFAGCSESEDGAREVDAEVDRTIGGTGGVPGTGQPGTGQPGTGQPGTGQPGTGQPGTGQPGTGQRFDAAPPPPRWDAAVPPPPPPGNRSCGETLACVEGCAERADCEDTCIAAGTLDARMQLATYTECVEINCGSLLDASVLCILEDCGTQRGACVSGPLTCVEVRDCVDACGDGGGGFECLEDCVNRGQPQAQILWARMFFCALEDCLGVPDCAACDADIAACEAGG
jgi:hypothetical protein